jgi:hypothetical protein
MGVFAVIFVVAIILDRRPYRPGKPNYVPMMIVGLIGIFVLVPHLISLLFK